MELITLTLLGVELDVEYHYEPAEPMIMYHPDMSGDPGSPAGADLLSVKHFDQDILMLIDDHTVETIKARIISSKE
jgi:hypothetical protein